MTYKVITYTSLILSLFAVGSLIAILVGDPLNPLIEIGDIKLDGIDAMLGVSYIVFGLSVLSILVRAVVIEMLTLPKKHNIIAISVSLLIPIIHLLYDSFLSEDPVFISLLSTFWLVIFIFIYCLAPIPIYYLVIRNKMPRLLLGLFFMCLIIANLTSDGLEIPMKDGEVLSVFSSNLVSSLLYTFYFLILIASLSMAYFGFKNRN